MIMKTKIFSRIFKYHSLTIIIAIKFPSILLQNLNCEKKENNKFKSSESNH